VHEFHAVQDREQGMSKQLPLLGLQLMYYRFHCQHSNRSCFAAAGAAADPKADHAPAKALVLSRARSEANMHSLYLSLSLKG